MAERRGKVAGAAIAFAIAQLVQGCGGRPGSADSTLGDLGAAWEANWEQCRGGPAPACWSTEVVLPTEQEGTVRECIGDIQTLGCGIEEVYTGDGGTVMVRTPSAACNALMDAGFRVGDPGLLGLEHFACTHDWFLCGVTVTCGADPMATGVNGWGADCESACADGRRRGVEACAASGGLGAYESEDCVLLYPSSSR